MRYQGFVTERKDPALELKAEYRAYYVPVQQREGGWFAAGPAQSDPTYDQVECLGNVTFFQLYRNKEDCGPLDDIASPDGHAVVARYWLDDDYVPPTPEQMAERHRKTVEFMKSQGLWRDRDA